MMITDWLPPQRCVVTHLGAFVRGDGIFEVLSRAPVDQTGRPQAEFRWTERIVLPLPTLIGKPLAAVLIGPLARIGLGWSLRRFARIAGLSS